jgi:hypothetical protein
MTAERILVLNGARTPIGGCRTITAIKVKRSALVPQRGRVHWAGTTHALEPNHTGMARRADQIHPVQPAGPPRRLGRSAEQRTSMLLESAG